METILLALFVCFLVEFKIGEVMATSILNNYNKINYLNFAIKLVLVVLTINLVNWITK